MAKNCKYSIENDNGLVSLNIGKNNVNINFNCPDLSFNIENKNKEEYVSSFSEKNICFLLEQKKEKKLIKLGKRKKLEINDNKITAVYSPVKGPDKIETTVMIEDKGIISFEINTYAPKNIKWSELHMAVRQDEHFYGFGEKFNCLDQRGNVVDLWVRNGAAGDKTYKPIPFLFSTANYGLYIDTTCRCICEVDLPNKRNQLGISVNDSKLKFYLILGDSPKDIISKYTSITGRPSLPPKWSFGPWKSRFAGDQCRHIIYEDADKHRRLDIPCNVIVLDGWWDQNMFEPEFNNDYYPGGEEMVADLHRQNYKVIGWIAPWVVKGGKTITDWKRCDNKGYFVKNKDGNSYICRLANSPHTYGSLVDFTNPEAVNWWKKRIEGFMKLGIDGIKTDFGEQVPADSIFYNGKTGREMHNVYPRIYNKLTWDIVSKKQGVLFGRSAWAGSQKYPGIWAGDQTADFCPWTGLGSVVIAGQSAALSGFPFWASDIGGYFSSPTAECFIRWAEFSAFCPWMQIHGNGRHEPWAFDKETEKIYRKYARLHTRLFPYIYSYAQKASTFGMPIIRPLVLNYKDDHNIYDLDFASYQYQFGQELLVAPIYWDNMSERLVYLPQGKWLDFWSDTEYDGKQVISYQSPLSKIPVFIKEGSIIPMLTKCPQSLVTHNKKENSDDLTVLIYSGNKNEFEFEMYNGTYFKYIQDNDQISLTIYSSCRRIINLEFLNYVKPDKVILKKKTGEYPQKWDYSESKLQIKEIEVDIEQKMKIIINK